MAKVHITCPFQHSKRLTGPSHSSVRTPRLVHWTSSESTHRFDFRSAKRQENQNVSIVGIDFTRLTFVSEYGLSLLTNDQLNVIREDGSPDTDVWAIGDAARSEGPLLPATAQGRSPMITLAHVDIDMTGFFWKSLNSGQSESEIFDQEIKQNCQGQGFA